MKGGEDSESRWQDWMGSSLDDWPPRLTAGSPGASHGCTARGGLEVKPRVQGFELHVCVPPMFGTPRAS